MIHALLVNKMTILEWVTISRSETVLKTIVKINKMTDTHGPLDTIPVENYPPLITFANYMAIKQMIDQVLNEDQEYVTWKLKSRRTGGTMNTYLEGFLNKSGKESYVSSSESSDEEDSNISSDEEENIGKRKNELLAEQEYGYAENVTNDVELPVGKKLRKVEKGFQDEAKPDNINSVPKNVCFAREIYDRQIAKLPLPRELDQSEQLKLLLDNLDDEQMNRFEVFRRTSLAKNNVKRISSMVTNQTVATNINLLLAGIGKIFVGEIVERALDVKHKWLAGIMVTKFHQRKVAGYKLKKYLKKLTVLVENAGKTFEDSVDEEESDPYEDDDKNEIKETKKCNELLKTTTNSEDVRQGIIKQYNKLVKEFNGLDVSVEKYSNSPLLPEHVREAWRLYRVENDTLPSGIWRTQGEANGWMFR